MKSSTDFFLEMPEIETVYVRSDEDIQAELVQEELHGLYDESAADLARAEANLIGPIDRRSREFRGYKLPPAPRQAKKRRA